jgi:hypothetical protein
MMKTIKIKMSDRCFRFKPDAIPGHAPDLPGVYEFVTFDEKQTAKVVFVGWAESSIQRNLAEHYQGSREPAGPKLLSAYPNMYFDYIAKASVKDAAEWKDVADALKLQHKPELNKDLPKAAVVEVKEVEIL